MADGLGPPKIRVLESSVAGLAGKEFPFVSDELTIGRSDKCSIPLKDNRVSREHARLVRSREGFRLRDLESANGIFVGNRPLQDAFIEPGTRFKIADTLFELDVPAAGPPAASPKEEFEATFINIPTPVAAAAPPAPPAAAPPPSPAFEFFVRIAESKGGETVGR